MEIIGWLSLIAALQAGNVAILTGVFFRLGTTSSRLEAVEEKIHGLVSEAG